MFRSVCVAYLNVFSELRLENHTWPKNTNSQAMKCQQSGSLRNLIWVLLFLEIIPYSHTGTIILPVTIRTALESVFSPAPLQRAASWFWGKVSGLLLDKNQVPGGLPPGFEGRSAAPPWPAPLAGSQQKHWLEPDPDHDFLSLPVPPVHFVRLSVVGFKILSVPKTYSQNDQKSVPKSDHQSGPKSDP